MRNNKLKKKMMSAKQAAELIEDGMIVATSGFTPAGYPKAVPLALAKRVKQSKEELQIDLLTGASVGEELDGALTEAGIIARRYPYQTNKLLRNNINSGGIAYADIHLSHFAQQVRYGFFGEIDLAIIEAIAIDEEGNIIPSTSVGVSPTFIDRAKSIIVEINNSQPLELEGIHDIYQPQDPPNRYPIPLIKPGDRIGATYIPTDPEKIKAIVITDIKDQASPLTPIDGNSEKIAGYIINFLEEEVADGRLPQNLLPLQSGVGSVANAVLAGLLNSPFESLDFYSEVIQDSVLDLIDSGKIRIASGTALTLSEEGQQRLINNLEEYKRKIILRPQEISNNPEIIRRIGSIAMNTAIEVDIYGNVNSTNIMGSKMMNGIGGSGDFTRNAYLSIFVTPSVAKNGDISCVVPMVSHVDHTEHDVQVIVTEQGIANLRGLSPRERAETIINNCTHPEYKSKLKNYYQRALEKGGHTPHLTEEALSWHQRFLERGSMK
ncbi:acetyl-CoA hydrolase/transferase family protein [Candidatus Atribacteria bacterium 1244-E10-H5-B2]|nr:MAG: acetyl-CoA hydrolase/transferase family protein [Candidatus Atribacteria bacterium 1244-E10-H5-B2]